MKGERRHQLKVTAYKQIIHLLGQMPTEQNLQMIVHEWERKELHRDVNIEIIRVAFSNFLPLLLLTFLLLTTTFCCILAFCC